MNLKNTPYAIATLANGETFNFNDSQVFPIRREYVSLHIIRKDIISVYAYHNIQNLRDYLNKDIKITIKYNDH